MAVDFAPVRHRPETVREQNLRIELAEARRDAIALCDALQPRLKRLHGVCALISPTAEQLAAGAVYDVQRYRARQGK
jgi:hypothetical protein